MALPSMCRFKPLCPTIRFQPPHRPGMLGNSNRSTLRAILQCTTTGSINCIRPWSLHTVFMIIVSNFPGSASSDIVIRD